MKKSSNKHPELISLWLGMALITVVATITYFDLFPSPKFEVGDCAKSGRKLERWETPSLENTIKILEVGVEKYRYAFFYSIYNHRIDSDSYITIIDSAKVKVECPAELKGLK